MTVFDKPALDIDGQLTTLRDRGLLITDEAYTRHVLTHIGYYRLSAYTRPFYLSPETEHHFLVGTTIDDVLAVYAFDRELRLLLLDAIERLEVALRAQLANTLAVHHGPHGYLDPAVFDSRYRHSWLLDKLEQASREREIEAFLAHYRSKYTAAPTQPPIWMAVELLTFKEVSTLFANLRLATDTQRIETHFGLRFPLLKSWFRSLSDLRNLCAHHARVWNREFGSRPEIPKRLPPNWPDLPAAIPTGSQRTPGQTLDPRRRLYMQLVAIQSLMNTVSPGSHWASRLIQLLDRHPRMSRPHMGFVPGWESEPLWRPAVAQARAGSIA
ncbi:Abi family protein [Leptothrix ochracea]|uniref:Abi family protein n=1 Tax=Leptothrix ochracea TaxID=735331 RepID=UPI0034E2DEF0